MSDSVESHASRALVPGSGNVPRDGVALCLSGGGYRAMLFHLGALRRLNDGGWLKRLDRISSVSGGSLAAGPLALAWPRLTFDAAGTASNFDALVAAPVRRLAARTVDARGILSGLVLPRQSIADRAAKAYQGHLVGDATLQDLPEHPRFIFCATNLQSGVLWRFSRPYMGDYRVGRVADPDTPLAVAIAASAAFPPMLSPLRLPLPASRWITDPRNDLATSGMRREAVLSDGGVYDNLGLETAWERCRTVLVSDGGGHMGPEVKIAGDWLRHMRRVLSVIDNQVRDLRKRQCIAGFKTGERDGTYWGIRTDIADYKLADALPCPHDRTLALADVDTRLKALDDTLQERLINWGYAVCDAAMRAHGDPALPAPGGFPFPHRKV